jgi:membrane-associated phospholipid phosphatase
MSFLSFLTNFGDPYMTAPLAAAVLGWLAATGRRRAALEWGGALGGAIGVVALSKFVYAGWGIGIEALRFTGVSGHTMLGTAVYPLVAAIPARDGRGARAALGGLLFAFAIGWSRVALGFHAWSEVVSGWVLGALVAGVALRRMRGAAAEVSRAVRRSRESGGGPAQPARTMGARASVAFVAAACAIVVFSYGHTAPVSAWISIQAPKMAEWGRTWFDDTR